MDEAGTQPAENPCVSQNGFVVLAKIEKLFTCGSVFRQPWFLIPLFALAGCFLTLCHCFSLDSFAKWACRRSCFLQHAPPGGLRPPENPAQAVRRRGYAEKRARSPWREADAASVKARPGAIKIRAQGPGQREAPPGGKAGGAAGAKPIFSCFP